MSAPKVSIVIPTYNRPDFLKETLKSLMAQTYTNFEVIVVDDGSTNDESKIVCSSYSNVTYVCIENSGGPAKPRNVGIKKAKGAYVAFVDDDDLWLPEKLEKQVATLEIHSDFGLVHGCCELIDVDGKLTGEIIGRLKHPSVKHGKVSMQMVGNWTLMTPTVMLRKEILDRVGNFNESMSPIGEDTEFWVRCSFYTSFYYLDEPLVRYRSHESNSVLLKTNAIYVPQHLHKAILELKVAGKVTASDYKIISRNLVRMQIKKMEIDFFKTLRLLCALNTFWFLNFENMKLFLQKIIAPRRT